MIYVRENYSSEWSCRQRTINDTVVISSLETPMPCVRLARASRGLRKEVHFRNLVLDELDRELERRGHRFVRYAEDGNIYVRSERAGQRVMESITRFITQRLKLKVNEAKSEVARPQERKFLGFGFSAGPEVKRVIAPNAWIGVSDESVRSRDGPRALG
jgi:hypothetical protein